MFINEILKDLMIKKEKKTGRQCHAYHMRLGQIAFLPGLSSPVTTTKSDIVVVFYLSPAKSRDKS